MSITQDGILEMELVVLSKEMKPGLLFADYDRYWFLSINTAWLLRICYLLVKIYWMKRLICPKDLWVE